MLPVFDTKRRRINLGGSVPTSQSHSSILSDAKQRRHEREQQKRQADAAVQIQAYWRGVQGSRTALKGIADIGRQSLQAEPFGLRTMRCVALAGDRNPTFLTEFVVQALQQPDGIFEHADEPSWKVLIQWISRHLLKNVTLQNTQLLAHILSRPDAQIMSHLLQYGYYKSLSRTLRSIPPESKSNPIVAEIVPLVTRPYSIFQASSSRYSESLSSLLTEILTLPVLPNRLPLPSLTHLSSHLPLINLHRLPENFLSSSLSPTDALHLLANLVTFTPPRYSSASAKLSAVALTSYLNILAWLLDILPVDFLSLGVPSSTSSGSHADSDDEHEGIQVHVVDTFAPQKPKLKVDAKTSKRLQALPTTGFLKPLLNASLGSGDPTCLESLCRFLLSLTSSYPSRSSGQQEISVWTIIGTCTPNILRTLWVGSGPRKGGIRSSALGKEANDSAIFDVANEKAWPPLLCFVSLYTQSLLTMGDDEFFGTAASSKQSSQARNPLSLDELVVFSRQLLNIAFTLYWKEDQQTVLRPMFVKQDPNKMEVDGEPNGGTRVTWYGVRELLTRCLVAVHARDSRKPFVPKGHWLVEGSLDMAAFVEAAIFEEQQLAESQANEDEVETSTNVLASPRAAGRSANTRSTNISKRQLSAMAPRLGILNNIPFAIPFHVRVAIFRQFVYNDKRTYSRRRYGNRDWSWEENGPRRGRTRASVRREHVAQDGFDKLFDADLKSGVEIEFIDQFGEPEAGIDGGGVFKEFFTALCKEVFDTDRGLWLANKKNELYPNPHAYATEAHSLNWYRFIGRVLGKAMYEGILVDVAFAGFFLAKWLGKQSFLDDLASLDPELYNGLIFLKHYTGDPEDLSLNFTVAVDEFGVNKSINLIPNGVNVPVTRENRLQYIYLVSHFRLTRQIKKQSEAFFEGLSEMIDSKWLRMFNQQEMQILIGGVNTPIDLNDLRTYAVYGGLYDDKDPTIVAFWNVVNTFDQEQRRGLLRFVTSCSRPPLLGFKELNPQFAIRDAGSDELRLPTSSTCVNLLKLPRYQSEKVLKAKLLQAINSGAGFDLS